ncbi:DUF1772 domain-containing protein [Spirosoma pollinicola]|uniref:DUF1772 domain-containing protein n=1 Tax=Spirosoma pollinicola TaxID=2057025 RepID=UPI001F0BE2B1|nr:DUF1772 domain-containing protein [Spirosoma pollinicola]
MSFIAQLLLSLFILNMSVALGAGLYEVRMIVHLWFPGSIKSGFQINSRAIRDIDSGRKFWAFVTTGPLTLLTIANLVLAWQSQLPGCEWWLTAALLILIERISTFSFFIPVAIKLQAPNPPPPERVNRLAALWIGFNYVRNSLTLLAWVFALRAFAFVV